MSDPLNSAESETLLQCDLDLLRSGGEMRIRACSASGTWRVETYAANGTLMRVTNCVSLDNAVYPLGEL